MTHNPTASVLVDDDNDFLTEGGKLYGAATSLTFSGRTRT